jgi:hypothetical protein
MDTSDGFSIGPRLSDAPQGDLARQAVAALRGYAFQLYGSVLAWLELKEGDDLFLEVAEDYAVVAQDALKAVQAKETRASGAVTLNTAGVREAINSFVDLTQRNPREPSPCDISRHRLLAWRKRPLIASKECQASSIGHR